MKRIWKIKIRQIIKTFYFLKVDIYLEDEGLLSLEDVERRPEDPPVVEGGHVGEGAAGDGQQVAWKVKGCSRQIERLKGY